MRSLIESTPEPQVFHCTGGADRTGFAAAILLRILGIPESTVSRDYLLTNQYLFSPSGRALLDRRTPFKLPAGLRMHARYLEAAFREIDKEYGTFDVYVRDGLGIDQSAVAELRSRYLQ
jgi:protein-tyrosine phosphatase